MATDMGMTNKQFQGFIRLALELINKALIKSPDNEDLQKLKDIGQWCRESWFEDRMKRWREESLEPFARGERLLADDFCIIHAGN